MNSLNGELASVADSVLILALNGVKEKHLVIHKFKACVSACDLVNLK